VIGCKFPRGATIHWKSYVHKREGRRLQAQAQDVEFNLPAKIKRQSSDALLKVKRFISEALRRVSSAIPFRQWTTRHSELLCQAIA
jgi:hypothetical protein